MSKRTIQVDDRLYDYIQENSLREDALLRRLREETARNPMSNMQISPEQGQFMALLAELVGAKNAIEIGTFTGYSAISVARVLKPGGKLICCDVSDEYTAVARRYWTEAGLADRIDLRLAPALQTLDELIAKGGAGTMDFAFIDADKENYDAYYERVLRLLRPGGLVTIDNVLWDGKVADPSVRDADDVDTAAIRALNKKLAKDERVALSLIPISDGLTLARKR